MLYASDIYASWNSNQYYYYVQTDANWNRGLALVLQKNHFKNVQHQWWWTDGINYNFVNLANALLE